MSIARTLALAASTAVLAATLTAAPVALANSSGQVAGVQVTGKAEAAVGWGSKCGSYYTRTIVNDNWVAVYRVDKYYYTTSLTGTRCIDRYKTFIRYESR